MKMRETFFHGYTLYNYLSLEWQRYENRLTEIDLKSAREFIPQTPRAQDRLTQLVSAGENIGVAMLSVLGDSKI